MIILVDNCWLYRWKIKNSQTITGEFLNILTTSKQVPLKIESDRGKERFKKNFLNFLNVKNIYHYSRFTDKGPSIAERVIRTIRKSLKKPVFEKGDANWLIELPSVIKKCSNTIHRSMKMTPIQPSKKTKEKLVYSNLRDDREKQKLKFKLGQLIRTANIKRVFSKGDSTNWS